MRLLRFLWYRMRSPSLRQEAAIAAEEAALLHRIAEEDSLLASEDDSGIYEVLEDGTLRSLLTGEVAEARWGQSATGSDPVSLTSRPPVHATFARWSSIHCSNMCTCQQSFSAAGSWRYDPAYGLQSRDVSEGDTAKTLMAAQHGVCQSTMGLRFSW